MAQKTKPKKATRVPAYSADTMALHLVGGLLLIALGVLLFMAVVAGMSGDVFAGMRQVCHGLAGGLAILLPIFPIWGGVLVILSTYRKAPLRTFLLAALLYLLVLTCFNLISRIGTSSLMQYFYNQNLSRGQAPTAFDAYLARSYEMGVKGYSGGVLGMLLAWPLYQLLGNAILGGVLCIIGALVDVVFLIRLDIPGIIAQLQGKADERQRHQQEEQLRLQQQELLWQQQMAERANQQPVQEPWQEPWQEPVYQQPPQQPYYEQPPYYQQTMQQPRKPVQSTGRQQTGFQPVKEEQWSPAQRTQEHPVQTAEPVENKGRLSRIFSRKEQQPENSAPSENKPRRSWIFGKKEDPAQPDMQQSARQQPVWTQSFHQNAEAARSTYARPVQESVHEEPVYQEPVYEEPACQEPPYEEPAHDEPVQQPVQQPAYAPPVKKTVSHRDEALWDDDAAPRRKASWRREDETGYQPVIKQRTAVKKPEPIPVDIPQTTPAAPRKQQPLPSWSETPPWEDAPSEPVSAAAVKAPKLQQEPPKDAWKPELKLPPRKEAAQGEQVEMELPPPYVYPGMDLLKLPGPQEGVSPEEDAMRSQRLEETLSSFKVPAKVRHVTHGPAISRFELELAPGIKVTKVTDLGKNIAMNMEVKSVRIEAPIPGKALVGVEVPNRKVSTVTLREVLESPPMQSAKSPLAVALGKDIAGTPIVCDLAKMPHLLIAGATGSGKSVCINTMINSLLYRCSPREVRLILVDPKVVELQCYNGIPHLLIPVVSDPHKASGALAWAVAEMMDRYKKFERKGVRAIDGYNSKLEDGEEFMPRIVIIIDELADLMMTCKREVEDHICRLAQLARAAGIHLVVATQRPSVDVITGLIKANIPSRIAFKVSSFIDSRTILDRQGAEQLLGWGDMLYLPTGEFTPIRIQGCFMSDNEVNRVTDFIRENCEVEYDPNILEQLEQLGRESAAPAADTADPTDNISSDASLLAQCIEMAVNDGQVSTSLLQRRLKVGYARAGRLVDEMERRGIVSAKDGAKPRMCLISREEFEQMRDSGELEE